MEIVAESLPKYTNIADERVQGISTVITIFEETETVTVAPAVADFVVLVPTEEKLEQFVVSLLIPPDGITAKMLPPV